MNLQKIIDELDLQVLTEAALLDGRETQHGYASDMLSCVMSAAKGKSLWITLQAHLNIVAVATLLDLTAIIITEGNIPDEAVITRANQEGVVLLASPCSTFEINGRLWALGIRA